MIFKHIYYIILYWILICIPSIYPIIIESDKIESVLDYISPETLVIFDIDNTLAHPIGELSSDEWFCYLVNQKMNEGYDYITAVYYALPITYYAQFNVDLQPTEGLIPYLLSELIIHKIPTMALTTRSLFVAERTLKQLEDISLYFLIPHISQHDLVLSMTHPCFYTRSILFSGNNDKGQALFYFFELMNYYPEKIVFIDDKMKYLLSVQQAAKSHNIPFIGIRYSGCDERVKNFDPEKAQAQWDELRYAQT